MEDLTKILEKTVSNLQSDQNEAVTFIDNYTKRDFIGFVRALSDILANQENAPVVRAAAGLQLKNQLTSRDVTLRLRQQERWNAIDEETRQYIKDQALRTLGTELYRPPAAPQCIAYIAVIELPLHRWPGLMQALIDNILDQSSNFELHLASLQAVAFICKDLDHTVFEPKVTQALVKAIVTRGMSDANVDDIRMASTTALVNLCDYNIRKVAEKQNTLTFDQLGEYLGIPPQYAERMVAQMIREERIKGQLDQIERVVQFATKDALQAFDDEILKLCSEVNDVIEKIRLVVPPEWWTANAHQT